MLRIPHVFHWVWLGPDRLPSQHDSWREGWLRAHPGWTSHLWTDDNLPPLINGKEFERATSRAQASDIVRYEVLLRHGGVYLDTDVECLRPLTGLVDQMAAFAGWELDHMIGTAVLGAAPDHPWMRSVVDALPGAFRTGFDVLWQTGPAFVTPLTSARDDVVVLPRETFHAASRADAEHAFHHREKSWHAQQEAEVESKLRAVVCGEIDPRLPAGGTWICVDDGLGAGAYSARRSAVFPAGDMPADDVGAIAALDALREHGAKLIAFIGPSRWWLDAYPGLAQHLATTARQVVAEDRVVIYDLVP